MVSNHRRTRTLETPETLQVRYRHFGVRNLRVVGELWIGKIRKGTARLALWLATGCRVTCSGFDSRNTDPRSNSLCDSQIVVLGVGVMCTLNPDAGAGAPVLKDVLKQFFKEHTHGVFTARGGSTAIWKHDGHFYFFDPHGCDENVYMRINMDRKSRRTTVGQKARQTRSPRLVGGSYFS
uniref:SFRICE_019653 n=1 Tax=Spodoptera frugiperda TaxID=7108 RepID=A0A2H1WAM5_SPOFR